MNNMQDSQFPNFKYGIVAARVIGSTTAGILEVLIFHPVDTVTKRLMTSTLNVRNDREVSQSIENLSKVIFRESYEHTILQRYTSLFPGLAFAAGYKILQKIYRFGGQPMMKDYLSNNYRQKFYFYFGDRHGKTILHATAGSLIGIGEVILLPLDVLRIRAQTNPTAIRGRGIMRIVKTEGTSLYRGASWTAARNAPGSFALFGGSAAFKEYVFHLENYNDATFPQIFLSSIAGASASVMIAQPLDVIKTRVQSQAFEDPLCGITILRKLLVEEGSRALFKGLITKLSVVGPKLVFSFSIAQYLIAYLEKSLVQTQER